MTRPARRDWSDVSGPRRRRSKLTEHGRPSCFGRGRPHVDRLPGRLCSLPLYPPRHLARSCPGRAVRSSMEPRRHRRASTQPRCYPRAHRNAIRGARGRPARGLSGAEVEGFQQLVPRMTNHPKDRHVVAAAVVAEARVILTTNLRDFPDADLRPWSIEAWSPDTLLGALLASDPGRVIDVLEQQARGYRRPATTLAELVTRLAGHVPTFAANAMQRIRSAASRFRRAERCGARSAACCRGQRRSAETPLHRPCRSEHRGRLRNRPGWPSPPAAPPRRTARRLRRGRDRRSRSGGSSAAPARRPAIRWRPPAD